MATSTKRNKNASLDLFLPAALAKIPSMVSLEDFLCLAGFSCFTCSPFSSRCFALRCGRLYGIDCDLNSFNLSHIESKYSDGVYKADFRLAYFESDSTLWSAKVQLSSDRLLFQSGLLSSANNRLDACLSIGQWQMVKNPTLSYDYVFMQSSTDLFAILKRTYPYVAEWALANKCPYGIALIAPYLEVLSKAGFAFVNTFLCSLHERSYTYISRLCQNGTKPKRIFKVQKAVYEALKGESNLSVWDVYRKLVKFGRLSAESISQANMVGLNEKQLELAHHVLGATYENKPVFTWSTLVNYLQRIDTFEAITCQDGLVLLRDYLSMCHDMGLKPKVDSDSLRREHDVLARNHRLFMQKQHDEKKALAIKGACDSMARLDYKEDVFLVRGIKSLEDLYNEGNQQRNCVASYANKVINGESFIFLMREVARPEKSLITIEIDPDSYYVRQKFLARNQPIRNKAQTDFINRWINHIRALRNVA